MGSEKGHIILTSPGGAVMTFYYAHVGAGLSAGAKFNVANALEDYDSYGGVYILDTFAGTELAPSDIEGGYVIGTIAGGVPPISPETRRGSGASASALLFGIPLADMQKEVVVDAIAAGVMQGMGGYLGDIAVNEGKVPLIGLLGEIYGGPVGQALKINKDALAARFQSSAKGLLVMAGLNKGLQLTIGVLGGIGYIWRVAPPQVPVEVDAGSFKEITTLRSGLPVKDASFIRMPGDALFGFDSDKLKAAAESVLLEVAAVIKKKSPLRIDIDGHTDSIGDVVYNRGLSKRRAQSVARWFIERNILKTAQITTNSYGESKPIEPNTLPNGSDNPGGREKNRRVEIFLFNK